MFCLSYKNQDFLVILIKCAVMKTSLYFPLQTCISGAMLEAEGGWGKFPKTMYAHVKKGGNRRTGAADDVNW